MDSLAVTFTGKEELELRTLSVPDPQPHEVQVEVAKTLISTGTECICYQRRFAPGSHYDQWVKYPFVSGYSAAGRIIKVGQAVTHLKIGDRVACNASHQRYANVGQHGIHPMPDGLSDEEATWASLAYITQHGFRKPQLMLGESVVVVGVGLLGQLIVQYARASGAGEVIAIDPAKLRLDMAASHGATHTLAMGVDDARTHVHEITGGRGANVLYEMTGHAQVFASALKLLGKHGRLGLIGDTGTPTEQHLTFDIIQRDLRIFGAHATNAPDAESPEVPWTKRSMVQLFFKLLVRGQMRVSDLITHRYDCRQAGEAFNLLCTARDQAMGVVLDWTKA